MAMAKTGSVDDAVERALARGKGGGGADDDAVVDPEEILKAEPEESEVITVGGDDDDDDDSKSAGGNRPSRRERRNERGWAHMEDQLQEERTRRAELEGRLNQLTTMALNQPRHQQGPQVIPEDTELKQLHDEMERNAIAWEARAKTATRAEYEEEKERARQIEIRKDDIMARRRERMRGGPTQGLSPREVQLMLTRQKYSDLMDHSDPRVVAEFQAEHIRRVQGDPRRDTDQTLAESAEAVRRKFGIGTHARRPPSARRQQQYSGTPIGAGSEDTGGGGGPLSVKVTPEIKEMARLAYGDAMPEKDRLQKWVKNNGRRYLEKQRGGGARSD